MRRAQDESRAGLWRVPVVLGVLTAAGLVAALLAEGSVNILSALALAAPLVTAAWCIGRRGGSR